MPRVEPAGESDRLVYLTVEGFTESMTADRAREVASELSDVADTVEGE